MPSKVSLCNLTLRTKMAECTKEILQREVARYNREFINKNRVSVNSDILMVLTVNLERVSHMIKDLYPEGNNFIGEARVLDTHYMEKL